MQSSYLLSLSAFGRIRFAQPVIELLFPVDCVPVVGRLARYGHDKSENESGWHIYFKTALSRVQCLH
jgi:hypothetical protein